MTSADPRDPAAPAQEGARQPRTTWIDGPYADLWSIVREEDEDLRERAGRDYVAALKAALSDPGRSTAPVAEGEAGQLIPAISLNGLRLEAPADLVQVEIEPGRWVFADSVKGRTALARPRAPSGPAAPSVEAMAERAEQRDVKSLVAWLCGAAKAERAAFHGADADKLEWAAGLIVRLAPSGQGGPADGWLPIATLRPEDGPIWAGWDGSDELGRNVREAHAEDAVARAGMFPPTHWQPRQLAPPPPAPPTPAAEVPRG